MIIEMQWKDVKLAPKDIHILCCHSEKKWIRFGVYISSHGNWYYSGTNERSQFSQTLGDEPTHWMEIPKLPLF